MAADALMQSLVADFVGETRELAEKITTDLLALERAQAGGGALSKGYTRLARGLHTIKGSANTIGLGDLAKLAHAMEDVVAPHQGVMGVGDLDATLHGWGEFVARITIQQHGIWAR